MRFSIKSVYAIATLAMVLMAQTAFAQQDRRDSEKPGWLGVSIQDVTEDLREALPRNVEEGALINHVSPESPADVAGLREGDVVVGVDRETISNSEDLTRAIREAGSGSRVRVDYYRDGRRRFATVELRSASDPEARERFRRHDRDARRGHEDASRRGHNTLRFFDGENWLHEGLMAIESTKPRLGVRMMDLGDQMADYFKVASEKGALVTEVLEDSPAEAGGIKAGDVITGLDDRSVTSSDGLRKALKHFDEGGEVKVEVVRNGRTQTVVVALEEVERPGRHSFMGPGSGNFPLIPGAPGSAEWRSEMKDLKNELKELRKELMDLRSDLR